MSSIADDCDLTDDNGVSSMACIVDGVSKNIRTVSIGKVSLKDWKKQCNQSRLTKTQMGGSGLPSSFVSFFS